MPGPIVSERLRPHSQDAFSRTVVAVIGYLISGEGAMWEYSQDAYESIRELRADKRLKRGLLDFMLETERLMKDTAFLLHRCRSTDAYAPYDDAMWDLMLEELIGAFRPRLDVMRQCLRDLGLPDSLPHEAVYEHTRKDFLKAVITLASLIKSLDHYLSHDAVDQVLASGEVRP